jgi:SAM-dependent methyltransferase/uncharacterized protein YbaR (Trm112 family)
MDILVCPLDARPLEMREWESTPLSLSPAERQRAEELGIRCELLEREIRTAVLVNPRLKVFYPVREGVPRLLTFPARVTLSFAGEHSEKLRRELPGFTLPEEATMPGEEDVLRTFSTEWINCKWDERAYWGLQPQHMFRVMHYMLDLGGFPVKGKRVLEVGIGIGGIADNIATTQGCELVGVDLSHAVEPAYHHFGRRNPFLHVIQASAFKMPFADGSFDFVYSHGVLHHTFSTKVALESVSRLPRPGGRLYVWVYSPRDEQRTLLRRALLALERVIRPVCWRLPTGLQSLFLAPFIPLYMVHQSLLRHGARTRYCWREAMHAARDRFTPRFAHRHTEEEVGAWFRALGYGQIRYVSQRDHPLDVPVAFVACTAVDGIRQEGS